MEQLRTNRGMRLYNDARERLYINTEERARFLTAVHAAPREMQTLCLTLLYTGCRISEALALMPRSVQLADQLITIYTLKRRTTWNMREVPVPTVLIDLLDEVHSIRALPYARRPLWQHERRQLNRVTAYRWVKAVMANANIEGPQATPKGLRHGFGIFAVRSGIQLQMISKWMGHASLATTAIYTTAVGPEELEIARRMWR